MVERPFSFLRPRADPTGERYTFGIGSSGCLCRFGESWRFLPICCTISFLVDQQEEEHQEEQTEGDQVAH